MKMSYSEMFVKYSNKEWNIASLVPLDITKLDFMMSRL